MRKLTANTIVELKEKVLAEIGYKPRATWGPATAAAVRRVYAFKSERRGDRWVWTAIPKKAAA